MTDVLTVDELLFDHAFAKLPEPVALVVSTHLSLSPAGRARYAACRALAGVLLDTAEPEPLAPDAWSRLERAIERADPIRVELGPPGDPRVPPPLRRFVPNGFEALPWRNLGPLQECELPLAAAGYRTRLIRLAAGKRVPRHTHEGHELTVVIEGGFRDEQGHHLRGDLVIADPSIDHRPVADEDGDCLSLTVMDAPLRLTGPIGRLLNPLLRI